MKITRQMRKIRRPIKKDYIPSLFTLLNMFLGFLAIISVVEGFYIRAAYLVMAAGIFDALDGKLARWIHVPSAFGMELDSLADLVSFSLAPSLMIWAIFTRDLHPVLGATIAGAPLIFGALRLARYNVDQHSKPKPYFEGLPAPVAAFVIVALVLFYQPLEEVSAAKVVLPMVMVVSFLMVSQIRYTKTPALSLRAGPVNTLFLLVITTTLFLTFFVDGRFLLPLITIYLLIGIVRWMTRTDRAVDFQSVEEEL